MFLLDSLTSNDCVADIEFNYTFTNTGLSCVEIVAIKASLGPVGLVNVDFSDVYSYSERLMCSGEVWSIPDRRSAVDLCTSTTDSWDIVIDVNDIFGRPANMTWEYNWTLPPTAAPTIGEKPFAAPSSLPSSAPSIDVCNGCTLTGLVSGGEWMEGRLFRASMNRQTQ